MRYLPLIFILFSQSSIAPGNLTDPVRQGIGDHAGGGPPGPVSGGEGAREIHPGEGPRLRGILLLDDA